MAISSVFGAKEKPHSPQQELIIHKIPYQVDATITKVNGNF